MISAALRRRFRFLFWRTLRSTVDMAEAPAPPKYAAIGRPQASLGHLAQQRRPSAEIGLAANDSLPLQPAPGHTIHSPGNPDAQQPCHAGNLFEADSQRNKKRKTKTIPFPLKLAGGAPSG